MAVWRGSVAAAAALLCAPIATAIQVDLTSQASVSSAASTVAWGMMQYYQGNLTGQTPGLLPGPYYWWEAGAMFGAMIDYWSFTGDTTYNNEVEQAILWQVGADDFMPINQTRSLGNDDQSFWAFTAMTAAESNFQNPPAGQPQWLALAQAVFNEQVTRWDTTTCGGGLRWQIYTFNTGYNLKNSVANGCFFNLAARLARYTGNDTYAQWAYKTYDWMRAVNLIDENYNVYDNAEADTLNCTQVDHNQWTYNAGTMLHGAATLYNYTNGSALWENRTQGILNAAQGAFFTDGVMVEICEALNVCNTDQHSFKAYLSRWMAMTTQMAAFTKTQVLNLLDTTAAAAAAQCDGNGGGPLPGTTCGTKWTTDGVWDGTNGVGQQMCALQAIMGTQINAFQAPYTTVTGGTSVGNPNAGSTTTSSTSALDDLKPATTGDKAGAGILTAVVLIAGILGIWFMTSTRGETKFNEMMEIARQKMKPKRLSQWVPPPEGFDEKRMSMQQWRSESDTDLEHGQSMAGALHDDGAAGEPELMAPAAKSPTKRVSVQQMPTSGSASTTDDEIRPHPPPHRIL